MKICIFAESPKFDLKLYKVLCSRILRECFGISQIEIVPHSFDPNGHGQLEKQSPTLIDLFAESNPNIDIFFIFRDSDELTYKRRRKKLKELFASSIKNFKLESLIIAAPQRNIEAWLITDIQNINVICRTTLRRFSNEERIIDPKNEFIKIWEMTGKKEKISVLACNIIETIDIACLYRRSEAFHCFHEDIRELISRILPGVRHRGHNLI